MIDFSDLDKASVLAALYNASKPQGMGFMHYDPTPMTREEADALLWQTTDFDYLKGRVMKVDLEGESFDPWGYNRDNGEDAAERVINELRNSGDVNPTSTQATHRENTLAAARDTKGRLSQKTTVSGNVAKLGLDDVAETLEPMIDEAIKHQK